MCCPTLFLLKKGFDDAHPFNDGHKYQWVRWLDQPSVLAGVGLIAATQ